MSNRSRAMGSTRSKVNRSVTATVIATAVALAVLLAGCGGSDGAASPPSSGAATPATGPVAPTDATGVAANCTTTTGPVTVAYDQVPGVDPNLLSVDVYPLPDGCGPSPVVFWVHGGGWRVGDKANDGADTKAAWAASHGWTLVSVNYRLSTDGSGVMWPTHGQDVADAVAWTLANADSYGIDPERVALMGHSAGAHIVSMVAVDPTLLAGAGLDRSDVDCLVALDTEGYDIQTRVDTGGEASDQLYANAFGTDPAAMAAASPLEVLRTAGGPVADAVIVTRGTPARRAQAQAFADELRAAGSQVQVVEANGYSHADVNRKLGAAGETVETPTITSFLQSCLA